jgi:hypothetical protein
MERYVMSRQLKTDVKNTLTYKRSLTYMKPHTSINLDMYGGEKEEVLRFNGI